ncbi:MAG: hypothetical protein JNM70_17065 [Anaerolineae bacterium]|nr:hypothetical protein [Anaerolineae bacterium]
MSSPLIVIVSTVIVFAGALLIAAPRKKDGCLAQLARFVGLLIGIAAAIGAVLLSLQGRISEPVRWLPLILTLIVGGCAVSLASLGWQTLLGRRHSIDKALDTALFNPFDTMTTNSSSGSNGLDDLLFSCGLFILMGVFMIGVLVAAFIEGYLLPKPTSPARNVVYTALSWIYAVGVHVGGTLGVVALFNVLFGGALPA